MPTSPPEAGYEVQVWSDVRVDHRFVDELSQNTTLPVEKSLGFVPVLLFALARMYEVSRIGQTLAAPQTIVLRGFLEEGLDLPEKRRAIVAWDPYHA